MSRRTPPDSRDPKAFAGLTARRRRLGLPVGRHYEGRYLKAQAHEVREGDFLCCRDGEVRKVFAAEGEGDETTFFFEAHDPETWHDDSSVEVWR